MPSDQTMQEQLADWGRQLDKLRDRGEKASEETLQELEKRYESVKTQAQKLAASSRDGAKDVAEKTRTVSGRLADGAGDIGEGFKRSWNELADAFERAGNRVRN